MYIWGKLQRGFPLSSLSSVQSHFLVGRIFSCISRTICRLILADENPFERKIEFPVIYIERDAGMNIFLFLLSNMKFFFIRCILQYIFVSTIYYIRICIYVLYSSDYNMIQQSYCATVSVIDTRILLVETIFTKQNNCHVYHIIYNL